MLDLFSKLRFFQTYLKKYKSLILVAGHSGTDVNEHHFGHICKGNIKPNSMECKQATACGQNIGQLSHIFKEKSYSNTSI